jgi:hypothetical protein
MTEDHLTAIISVAEAKKDSGNWWVMPEGRHATLYASSQGSSLTMGKVEALALEGPLLRARTARGEVYVVALVDVFAGQVEPQPKGVRRAGFGGG